MSKTSNRWMWNGLTVSDLTGGASFAVGVIGYFAQRAENRRIIGLLKDIKQHLNRIETKIDTLIAQNIEILNILDELPNKIRAIVREEVRNEINISKLGERYSSLNRIQNNYFLLPEDERTRYRIHSSGWDELSDILTYLFLYENRLSYMARLITASEFAQVASEKRATGVILNLVTDKRFYVNSLFMKVVNTFNEKYTRIIDLLDSEYVESYNLEARLEYRLEYQLVPQKQETTLTLVWPTQRERARGWNGEPREVWVRNPENDAFNNERNRVDNEIQILNNELASLHTQLIHFLSILRMLDQYIEILNEDLEEVKSLITKENVAEGSSPKSVLINDYFIGYEVDD